MCMLLIFLILPFSVFGNVCSPCSCYLRNNFTISDCGRSIGAPLLIKVPKNLDKNVNILNLSGHLLTELRENNFAELIELQVINLYNNKISIIDKNALSNLAKLTTLVLNRNKIENLPQNLFTHTPQITHIDLSYNKISVLQKNVFVNLTILKEVRIMSNTIQTIEDESFSNLPSLKLVDLSYNKLKHLQITIADDSKILKYFALHGNPWDCQETLCPIMNLLSNWDYIHFQPQCEEPATKYYKKWNELSHYFVPTIKLTTSGQTVQLHCEYCFASKIIWKFNDGLVTENHDYVVSEGSVTSTLTLKNVTREGTYSCEVPNCTGCERAGVFVHTNMNVATNSEKDNVIIEATTISISTAMENMESTKNDSDNRSNNSTETETEVIGYKEESNFMVSYLAFIVIILGVILITIIFMIMFWYKNKNIKHNHVEEYNLEQLYIRFGPDPMPFPPPEPRANNRTRGSRHESLSTNRNHRSQADQDTSEGNTTNNSSEVDSLIRETPVNYRRDRAPFDARMYLPQETIDY